MTNWREFSTRELRESGLLWEVNRLVFWPHGVALQVTFDPDTDQYGALSIKQLVRPETIVDGGDYPAEDHPAIRFATWSASRRAACVVGDAHEVVKKFQQEDPQWPVDS